MPPQVVGGTIGNTSIGLRWKGNDFLPKAEFLVQLRRGDSTSSWHYYQPVTVLKRNRVLVQNLKPFTKYQVFDLLKFYLIHHKNSHKLQDFAIYSLTSSVQQLENVKRPEEIQILRTQMHSVSDSVIYPQCGFIF